MRYTIYKKGQNAVAAFLYFLMAVVCVALLMPLVRTSIQMGINGTNNGTLNYQLMHIIFTFWPVWLTIFMLVILVIIIKR